jgi:hypothetical protein
MLTNRNVWFYFLCDSSIWFRVKDFPLRGFAFTLTGHITLGRTPLDEWSARHRDLYLPTHKTNKRETSIPPAGFERAIPASEQPQTHAIERTMSPGSAHFKLPQVVMKFKSEAQRQNYIPKQVILKTKFDIKPFRRWLTPGLHNHAFNQHGH